MNIKILNVTRWPVITQCENIRLAKISVEIFPFLRSHILHYRSHMSTTG